MSREEKLAHGAKIAKKIKTIAISPRQQGMRINLGQAGQVLCMRTEFGFTIIVEASVGRRLHSQVGILATKVEILPPALP